jgi:aspartyl-tRNA(Asn)/glutamyl-tRNA(Gln) amidotransferase subunit B
MGSGGASAGRVVGVRPIVGMEIHVELATRRKMFSWALSPAGPGGAGEEAAPNTLVDPVVLALPGALPVVNREAIELAMAVGVALGSRIAERTRWDRKNYFYPDLPKAYQISQQRMPVCVGGEFEIPAVDDQGRVDLDGQSTRVRIHHAHLEEDAGKLMHEAPGGGELGFSIVDLNRAGTPLLEIVTEPDFVSGAQCAAFARELRRVCRFVGATLGVMQAGHMRFEPNINCELTLSDGRRVRTPIVEVKNLNSFRAVKEAVDHELREQPGRWAADGREMGPGAKTTRGWDDARLVTLVQREKEDAQDYRYLPDPDLPVVRIDAGWVDRARARVGELPLARMRRFAAEFGIAKKEVAGLVEERGVCELFEGAVEAGVGLGAGLGAGRAEVGRAVAGLILQAGARVAKARGEEVGREVHAGELGVDAAMLGELAAMRAGGEVSANNAERVFEAVCVGGAHAGERPRAVAERLGVVIVRDDAALARWIDEVIAANAGVVEQVRSGKVQAAGRLIGEVMKRAGGAADAAGVRAELLKRLGVEG